MANHFNELVPAGRWEVVGFHYGSSRCQCCGRPISRVLHLKNRDHDAKVNHDSTYAFSEEIHIGTVCGPKVFKSSCVGFYENPELEWARQYEAIKSYIDWVMACALNRDVWAKVPADLRAVVDDYIDNGAAGEEHSGGWMQIREAKKRVLKTKRQGPQKEPKPYLLWYNSLCLLNVAVKKGLVKQGITLMQNMQLVGANT